MSYSLLFKKKKKRVESVPSRGRDCFSSAFRERDSRRSETRTNAFHPFFHPNPPAGDTVLRRAPRSLGSPLNKCLHSQDSLHSHTKQTRSLSRSDIRPTCVRSNLILFPGFNDARSAIWSVGNDRQKHKSAHKTTDVM